ncbi:J domain-containing protein [Salmonella enterica]|nr:J domain-containing protein [Salmonella enterica subsp. enterica]EBN8527246.1 J domain-containing protein [Salmonella enterica]EDX9714543.1 J domain-containing protein [Salmonella enterica subsp. salamae]EBO9260162.1 J domain-containing protein [Salmonella enterica]EBP0436444.1 J domain-containing protein [Salmonella enterica]
MKNCWDILNITQTTDRNAIRQAYLALLPSFHPESDPQGFKQLRQAYEEAQQWEASSADEAQAAEVSDEHEMLVAFRELLVSDSDRFQPSAWQTFIQQLNLCSMDEVDKLRWPLCDIAMETETISLSCLSLLAQRLNWQPQEAEDDAEAEELDAFLEAVKRGDAFDLLSLTALPPVIQNQTHAYFFELEHIWRFYPEHFADALQQHGAWVIPEDQRLHRKLLHWFSAQQWGVAELVDIARRWQAAEPDNEDAHYYLCKQRLLCGEGESLLADLCDFWQRYPSTQADDLLLGWCRQHRPDFFPLVVMAVEARCMADVEYVPGESARTRLLWADILLSGTLSPLGRSFVESLFYERKPAKWWKSRLAEQGEPETPLLDLYRTAEQVALEAFPNEKPFYRLLIRLEAGDATPLEALLTRMLHTKAEMEPEDILLKDDLAEELAQAQQPPASLLQEDSPAQREQESRLMKTLKIMSQVAAQRGDSGNLMKILRIIGLIVIVIGALNRFYHFF